MNTINSHNQRLYDQNLLTSCYNGSRSQARKWLQQGANTEVRDLDQNTPLIIATKLGYTKLVRCLLAWDANINAHNYKQNTALHVACKKNLTEIAEVLIFNDANATLKNSNGFTPFYLAAHKGNQTVLRALLYKGIDVRSTTSPLDITLQQGNFTLAFWLATIVYNDRVLQQYTHINECIHKLITRNYDSVKEFMEDMMFSITEPVVRRTYDRTDCTLLHIICCSIDDETAATYSGLFNKWHIIERLYDLGCDFNAVDTHNNSALMWAIANANNTAAMKLLEVAHNKNIPLNLNSLDTFPGCGNTPLHLAIGKGYKNVSKDGEQLLYSNYEIAQKLIECGADVNSRDARGFTPLHIACLRRDVAMATLLLKYGARKDIASNAGLLPYDMVYKSKKNAYAEAEALLQEFITVFILDKKKYAASANTILDLLD